jgi:tRNA G10  N-methylase Trm11
MVIAKALVSIASKGNREVMLLDACCGVGTVVLEACYSGFKIDGCDINWRAVKHTRENLEHYAYVAEVYRSDIKDLTKVYDAIIIDLPYNIYTYSDDTISRNIIQSSANLSDRVIIVSVSDMASIISGAGLNIIDYCTVGKRGKSNFERLIWVCENLKR